MTAFRNYKQRSLLSPVDRKGKTLHVKGRHILEFLLIQRYLYTGGKLSELKEYMADTPIKELIDLIQADSTSFRGTIVPYYKESLTKQLPRSDEGTINSKQAVWYHLKLIDGIEMHCDATKYSLEDTAKLKKFLFNALDQFQRISKRSK